MTDVLTLCNDSYMPNTPVADMTATDLDAAFRLADRAWETDRRAGGWNSPQRERRNELADEILRRKNTAA